MPAPHVAPRLCGREQRLGGRIPHPLDRGQAGRFPRILRVTRHLAACRQGGKRAALTPNEITSASAPGLRDQRLNAPAYRGCQEARVCDAFLPRGCSGQ